MIPRNISLKSHNTFGLDYKADCLLILRSEQEVLNFLRNREQYPDPLLIIGKGSNILFTSDFPGTLLLPAMEGMRVEEQHGDKVIVSAGAGVEWDRFVEWCVGNGYGGVENLSLIPGKAGASPIQNIGAYGVEVKDTLLKVTALRIEDGKKTDFSNEECRFGYRNSIFKEELKGKYIILKVYFSLSADPVFNTGYDLLKEEVNRLGGESLRNIRQAVIDIRRMKLPDPDLIGNAGSFFKNPVVTNVVADNLRLRYPFMPAYPDKSGGVKLAAAWMIDKCGWKGKRIGDAGVHDRQPLVLVNYGMATGMEIYDLSEMIKKSVFEEFGIWLEREVELIGIT